MKVKTYVFCTALVLSALFITGCEPPPPDTLEEFEKPFGIESTLKDEVPKRVNVFIDASSSMYVYTAQGSKFHSIISSMVSRIPPEAEIQYPAYYYGKNGISDVETELFDEPSEQTEETSQTEEKKAPEKPILQPGNITIQENQTGISYRRLFARYLKGSKKIEIMDPFIQAFYQARNLMEFMEMVAGLKNDAEQIEVHLITKESDHLESNQEDYFQQIKNACGKLGIAFSSKFDPTIHDRYIQSDNGWKIIPGRGLDVYQPFDSKDAFTLENRNQRYRKCRGFEVTYIKTNQQKNSNRWRNHENHI